MNMTDHGQRRLRSRKRVIGAGAVLLLLLAGLLVPPWVSVSRYQGRISQLIATSLGRPVRLSSVELRLLPRPGFVLTDLTVAEDPAYGTEPVLHANSVTADIRLRSLWRGHLEISQISVDEASLNLVRSSSGHWNVEELFRTAAQAHGTSLTAGHRLPYLEASASRINLKNGLVKLPYSLVDADIDLWQDQPGEWRIRLRGQPARTDVSLDLADTGILRVEGSVRQAPQLRQMPVHLEMEWRDAQLGQLSRLALGSDPGWRGDLRGNLQLDGTAESATVQTRLRAAGVHRAEFAPAAPLDFDANCSFNYHYSARSLDKLACDSPLGDGRIHLSSAVHAAQSRQFQVQLQRIPAQAALDLLRTVRNGMDASLQADGSVSGELTYATGSAPNPDAATAPQSTPGHPARKNSAKTHKTPADQSAESSAPLLTGSLNVEGLRLAGASLKQPIDVGKAVLEADSTKPGVAALTASLALPAGGEAPLTVGLRITGAGYSVSFSGPASLARLKEMAQTAGASQVEVLDNVAGEPVTLDLQASGPWLPREEIPSSLLRDVADFGVAASKPAAPSPAKDQLIGTVILHNANWKTPQLASPVEIPLATLHLNPDGWLVDPLQFVYGPMKGSGSLQVKAHCDVAERCAPLLHLDFDALNSATVQATLLGARQQGSALAELIARFTSASAVPWPDLDVSIQANSLALGPVQLQKPIVMAHIHPASAEITSIDAGLFGGKLRASGTVTQGDKPKYAIEGELDAATGAAVCQFVGLHCTGGPFSAQGKVEAAGFAASDLASSAKGDLHFDWRRGGVSKGGAVPVELARFAQWSGDAAIAHGEVALGQNAVTPGPKSAQVAATIPLTDPPRIRFAEKQPQTASAQR